MLHWTEWGEDWAALSLPFFFALWLQLIYNNSIQKPATAVVSEVLRYVEGHGKEKRDIQYI